MRQLKREVKIGNVTIGGKNPIAVQTMLNVPVEDIEGNVAQAKRCEAAGCQILRVTCPSAADAKCIEAVKNAVNIPIVADIHFDYKAALACADVGESRRAGLPAEEYPHPHRRQRRQPGKAHPGQVRRSRAGGHGGERPVSRPSTGKV